MNVVRRMLSLIVLLCLIGGLYGCTKQSPSDAVKTYLEQVKKADKEELTTLFSQSLNENQILMKDLNSFQSTEKLLDLMKTMTYTINSEEIQGESAKVNATVNGPDLAPIVREVIQKVFTNSFSVVVLGDESVQEEMNKLYDTLVLESLEKVKNTERSEELSLVKVNGQWEIKQDESLIKLLINIDESMFGVK